MSESESERRAVSANGMRGRAGTGDKGRTFLSAAHVAGALDPALLGVLAVLAIVVVLLRRRHAHGAVEVELGQRDSGREIRDRDERERESGAYGGLAKRRRAMRSRTLNAG